ncbi:MAG: PilZ domain-containing protein [Vicinamibacterales bacterium]
MGAQTLIGAATRTVVVADETEFVRNRFRTALVGAGHKVILAGSRPELLDRVRAATSEISLVVLDARLSASDVGGLIRQLYTLLPNKPPIVAFSGTIGNTAAVRALAELDVTAFINEYTGEQNILRALGPFLGGNASTRRSSPRVALGTAVSFRLGQTIVTAVTSNISRGGVAVRSTNPFALGTDVRLRLRLPFSNKEVEAEARVVWSKPGTGMGLQFSRVSPAHQAAIDEFVNGHFFANRKG